MAFFTVGYSGLNALNVGRWMLGGRSRTADASQGGGLNALNVGRWMLGSHLCSRE